MKEKDVKRGMSKEESKGLSRKLRKSLETGDVASIHQVCATVLGHLGPRSIMAFPVASVPESATDASLPQMNSEHEKLEKLYSSVATNLWRIKNQILDAENNGEPKESLADREIAKIARYINSLEAALANGGIEVIGDYVGKPHREGSAVKVVSYEERQDLSRDEYVEVLMPTVRWTTPQGQTRLLQPAEVVVGRPQSPSPTPLSETL